MTEIKPPSLDAIVSDLALARKKFDAAPDAQKRREAVCAALSVAAHMVRWSSEEGARHEAPLLALLGALESLDSGTVDPLLAPAERTKRPPAPLTRRANMTCAAALVDALAQLEGTGIAEAESCVARNLKINKGALRSWRKQVMAGGKGDTFRTMHRELHTRMVEAGLDPTLYVLGDLASRIDE